MMKIKSLELGFYSLSCNINRARHHFQSISIYSILHLSHGTNNTYSCTNTLFVLTHLCYRDTANIKFNIFVLSMLLAYIHAYLGYIVQIWIKRYGVIGIDGGASQINNTFHLFHKNKSSSKQTALAYKSNKKKRSLQSTQCRKKIKQSFYYCM